MSETLRRNDEGGGRLGALMPEPCLVYPLKNHPRNVGGISKVTTWAWSLVLYGTYKHCSSHGLSCLLPGTFLVCQGGKRLIST